jgi:hypothetical protein
VPKGYKEDNWKRNRQLGAAIQRGIQYGSRGITIVGAVTRQLLMKTLQTGKDVVCALVICKVRK